MQRQCVTVIVEKRGCIKCGCKVGRKGGGKEESGLIELPCFALLCFAWIKVENTHTQKKSGSQVTKLANKAHAHSHPGKEQKKMEKERNGRYNSSKKVHTAAETHSCGSSVFMSSVQGRGDTMMI